MHATPPTLILFAHGARDARWREPFDRLQGLLQARQPEVPVRLAFLELMTPSLAETVEALHREGCRSITVVPVFFGQGGHIRRDLPQLLDELRASFADLHIACAQAVGEDDSVLGAIAEYCVRAQAQAAAGTTS